MDTKNEKTPESATEGARKENREAVGKAIDAVEYRIEKTPVPKNMHYSGMIVASCPTCGEELDGEEYRPSCGQALKWEDYDGES
jgi:hypothetical protein